MVRRAPKIGEIHEVGDTEGLRLRALRGPVTGRTGRRVPSPPAGHRLRRHTARARGPRARRRDSEPMQTDARDAPRDDGRTGPAVGALVAIALVGLALPLVLAAHYHALGIPRSDDWSYLVTEFRWMDSGRLSFNHWVSMSLVGQLVLGAPIAAFLPRDIGALQVATAALGTVGLAAVWWTARRLGVRPAPAALLAVTIAAGPLWGPLAASFMTDVPAFAVSSIAVALAVAGLTGAPRRQGWMWAAIATAVLACTIRQYAAVTLVAILLAAWCAAGDDRRARRNVVEAGVLAIAVVAIFLLWWRTVPDGRSLSPGLPDVHAVSVFVSKGAGLLRLLGLLLLPVFLAARPVARLRAAWRNEPATTVLVGGVTAIWLAVAAARAASDLFVGNYLERNGALSDIVLPGIRPDVLPGWAWFALVVAASVAGVALAVVAAHACVHVVRTHLGGRGTAADPVTVLLAASVIGYLTGYVIAMLTGIQVYDRYVLPVLPAAGLLLLRAPVPAVDATADTSPARVGAASLVALLALGAVGFAFAADSASFDGARWRVAQAAVARGWPVARVAGGFEWRAYRRGDRYPTPGPKPPPCVAVKIDPHVRADRIVAIVRSTAPTRRTARLVAFRTRANCPIPVVPIRRAVP
jgi:hypothetical protein